MDMSFILSQNGQAPLVPFCPQVWVAPEPHRAPGTSRALRLVESLVLGGLKGEGPSAIHLLSLDSIENPPGATRVPGLHHPQKRPLLRGCSLVPVSRLSSSRTCFSFWNIFCHSASVLCVKPSR